MIKEVSQSLTLYALLIMVPSKTPEIWLFELPWQSFFPAGLALNIHLMYAGECAPRKLRGLIAITASTAIAIGKFVGFALGLRYGGLRPT